MAFKCAIHPLGKFGDYQGLAGCFWDCKRIFSCMEAYGISVRKEVLEENMGKLANKKKKGKSTGVYVFCPKMKNKAMLPEPICRQASGLSESNCYGCTKWQDEENRYYSIKDEDRGTLTITPPLPQRKKLGGKKPKLGGKKKLIKKKLFNKGG